MTVFPSSDDPVKDLQQEGHHALRQQVFIPAPPRPALTTPTSHHSRIITGYTTRLASCLATLSFVCPAPPLTGWHAGHIRRGGRGKKENKKRNKEFVFHHFFFTHLFVLFFLLLKSFCVYYSSNGNEKPSLTFRLSLVAC